MAGLSVDDLPWPADAYRVDLQCQRFETIESCAREDAYRAGLLRSQSVLHGGEWGDRARDLAGRIDPAVTRYPTSLASRRYFRGY